MQQDVDMKKENHGGKTELITEMFVLKDAL